MTQCSKHCENGVSVSPFKLLTIVHFFNSDRSKLVRAERTLFSGTNQS